MYKWLIIFLVLSAKCFGQDTLFFRNGDKIASKIEQISQEEIKYYRFNNLNGPVYSISKEDVTKIRYKNGVIDYFNPAQIITLTSSADTTRTIQSQIAKRENKFDFESTFKIKILSAFDSKLGFAYEKKFKKKYSWEFEPVFIYSNPLLDIITNLMWPNLNFKGQGVEFSFGLNSLKIEQYGYRIPSSKSRGLFISYKYWHASNVGYWSGGMSGSSYYTYYKLSQTRNLIGIFYKINSFRIDKKWTIEKFLCFGSYVGYVRTMVFEVNPGSYSMAKTAGLTTPQGLFFGNGLFFMPSARVGLAFRYNKKSKN